MPIYDVTINSVDNKTSEKIEITGSKLADFTTIKRPTLTELKDKFQHVQGKMFYRTVSEERRQRGRVVRAPDLKSGDPEFESRSDHFVRGSPLFNSSAALVHSQLVCLLPVGILNLLSSFQLLVSLALKSLRGEWSITYVCMYVRVSNSRNTRGCYLLQDQDGTCLQRPTGGPNR